MIQRSLSTGQWVFPPRVMAPGNDAQDLEWVEASGRGKVHSYTIVSERPPSPGYNICLVDIEEGPRVMTRLVDVLHDAITIDMPVEAAIDVSGDAPVLTFRPVPA